jgi:hypothetical protein
MEPEAPTTDRPPERPDTFDVRLCDEVRRFILERCAAYPEVRTVAVVVDYKGAINDAQVHDSVWLEIDAPNGIVNSPAAAFGSALQTIKLLDGMVGRLFGLVGHLREHAEVLLIEQRRIHDEIEREKAARPEPPPGAPEG